MLLSQRGQAMAHSQLGPSTGIQLHQMLECRLKDRRPSHCCCRAQCRASYPQALADTDGEQQCPPSIKIINADLCVQALVLVESVLLSVTSCMFGLATHFMCVLSLTPAANHGVSSGTETHVNGIEHIQSGLQSRGWSVVPLPYPPSQHRHKSVHTSVHAEQGFLTQPAGICELLRKPNKKSRMHS